VKIEVIERLVWWIKMLVLIMLLVFYWASQICLIFVFTSSRSHAFCFSISNKKNTHAQILARPYQTPSQTGPIKAQFLTPFNVRT